MNNLKKIVSLETLRSLIIKKKTSLAHGVFDVFHIGHLKHLQIAKQKCDVLIVSITSDRYVRKGPSRPYFNEKLRAEFLSSLEIVDYVIINDDVTPIKIINTIKPNFYVKGKDYQDSQKDITGNISKEKRAVKSYGGEILITDDIEFSSSKIINKFLQPSAIRDFFQDFNKLREQCIKAIENLKDLNVLVLGEVIFDEYNFVQEMDKPGKENIQSVLFKKKELYLGGAYSIAKNVSSFVKQVEIISIGNFNKNQTSFLKKNSSKIKNLKLNLIKDDFHSIVKKRYINESNRKLFEEYKMIGEKNFKNRKFILKKKYNYDLIILADFGHGLISNDLIKHLSKKTRFLSINVQTNSENRGYNFVTKYKKANYICIDRQELRLAMSDRYSNINYLVKKLFKRIKVKIITITLGREGILVAQEKESKIISFTLPGFETNPIDTLGAGDAVFGISSLLVRKKTNLKLVATISNLVGAMKTKIIGHSSSITKMDLIKSLTYVLK
jgi:rfaE bifunctional protein nucleotidyltransferase chain/domain